MKSDLRNMATYEEQYAADNNGAYFGGTAASAVPLQGFSPSQNVTVVIVYLPGPPASWSGTATLAVSEDLHHDQRRDRLRLSFNRMKKAGTA